MARHQRMPTLRGRIYVCSRAMSAKSACLQTGGSPYTVIDHPDIGYIRHALAIPKCPRHSTAQLSRTFRFANINYADITLNQHYSRSNDNLN
jgi:hypothetical protein